MASVGTLLRLELTKAVRRPMTWILGVIFVGFMLFMYFALTVALFAAESDMEGMEGFDVASLEQQLYLPDSVAFGSGLVVGIGAIIVIVFAGGLFGSEFGWATVRTSLLMRAGRMQLIAAKLITLVLGATAVAVLGFGAVFVGSIAAEVIVGDAGSVPDRLTGELLLDTLYTTLRSIVALALWGLIAGMLALALSSMAIGIGIALAAYFVGDIFVTLIGQLGTVGEWFMRLTPTYSINQLVMMSSVSPPTYETWELVAIVVNLVAYTVIFIALGVYRFRKMDVIAAST